MCGIDQFVFQKNATPMTRQGFQQTGHKPQTQTGLFLMNATPSSQKYQRKLTFCFLKALEHCGIAIDGCDDKMGPDYVKHHWHQICVHRAWLCKVFKWSAKIEISKLTWLPVDKRHNEFNSIHPLLVSSVSCTSKNSVIARLASSVDLSEALRRISVTISLET